MAQGISNENSFIEHPILLDNSLTPKWVFTLFAFFCDIESRNIVPQVRWQVLVRLEELNSFV